MNKHTVPKQLKKARISCVLTQEEFAQAVSSLTNFNITANMVSRWETGAVMPKADQYLAILKTSKQLEEDELLCETYQKKE